MDGVKSVKEQFMKTKPVKESQSAASFLHVFLEKFLKVNLTFLNNSYKAHFIKRHKIFMSYF